MAESVPYTYLDATGVIVADTENILSDIQTEYQTTFGTDLVVTSDTPQGVLITTDAIARSQEVNNNAALANQINPNIAGGIFLDAVMALLGIQRTVAPQTFVSSVTLTGVAGTVIPAGTQAQTAAGDIFSSASTVTLDGSGNATVNFYSVAYGAIPCAIGALTQIITAVLGWETVTNPIAGVLGTSTQSDQAARAYRNNVLAFQGVALPVAATSALYNVPGVQSVWYQENIANTTQTINGISMSPHSVYAAVYGGTTANIAAALLENKSSGANWNGGTTVNVIEPASGQTYAVKFDVATTQGILVEVTTVNGNATNIQQAVLDYFAGNIAGFTPIGVGTSISAFEIAGAIMQEQPTYYMKQVRISLVSPVSYSTNEILIPVNQIAVTQATYITTISASS